MRRRPNVSRESLLILVDQIVSSASNALAVFIAAWSLDLTELNVYSILQLAVTTLLGLQRAIYIEPGLSLTSGEVRVGHSLRWVACTWFPLAGIIGIAAALAIQSWVPLLVAILGTMPGVQDLLRYRLFALRRVRRVLISDLVWLILLLAGYFVLTPTTAASVLLLWSGAAGVAALVAISGSDARSVLPISKILRLGGYQVVDWALAAATSTLPLFVIGALIPSSPVGAYRLAQTLTGPLNTVSSFVTVRFLVDASHLKGLSRRSGQKLLRKTGIALCGVAALYSIFAITGVTLLGSTFGSAVREQLLVALPVTLASSIITAPATAYVAFIRARSQQKLAIRPRLLTLAANVLGVVGGIFLWFSMGLDPLVLPILTTAIALLLSWRTAARRATR